MSNVTGLRCVECGAERAPDLTAYTCSSCGGNLDALYNYDDAGEALRRGAAELDEINSIWRYAPLLPVEKPGGFDYPVGCTPLLEPERLRDLTGMSRLFLKDDTRNPTASLKDRASAVAVAIALKIGAETITCASTGNAASSMAGLAAAAGIRATVFLPEDAPAAKLYQMLVSGAKVFRVVGSYDDAYDLCLKATEKFGWYNRSSGFNPYLAEGKKTAALEICEQLGWQPPDAVIVPVGDGCIIGGMHKGFKDLVAVGAISELPRLIAVQAEGADPIVRAHRTGGSVEPVETDTIADGIAVGRPRDAVKALNALKESGGNAVTVTDEEMLKAVRALSSEAGVFTEPAAAASYAGLLRCLDEGLLARDERVVLLLTGHGLKSPASAAEGLTAVTVEADESSLERIAESCSE